MEINSNNLIEMLPEIGPWSTYALAEKAIICYCPEVQDEDGDVSTEKAASCLNDMGLSSWQDVIIKYHTEIGYSDELLSDNSLVNEN